MDKLLGKKLFNILENSFDIKTITEIRIRLNKPLVVKILNKNYFVKNISNSNNYIASNDDIKNILLIASNNSMYSVEDELCNGYITYKNGIRIGVIGECVYVNKQIKTIKNITSLVIRLPHEILGCSNQIFTYVFSNNLIHNTIILSKPGMGKTTLLRDLARNISSYKKDTIIVDERNEIASYYDNNFNFDVGDFTDVFTFISKSDSYEKIVRACNPSVIIIDEIVNEFELLELLKIASFGISIIGSRHFDSSLELNKDVHYDLIKQIFDYAVVLDNFKIGKINKVISLKDA